MEQRQHEIIKHCDKVIIYGYDNGLWQSCILHTIVLLCLAFVIMPAEIRHKPIILSFDTAEQNIVDITPIDLEVNIQDTIQADDVSDDIIFSEVSSATEQIDIKPLDISDPSYANTKSVYVSFKNLTSLMIEQPVTQTENIDDISAVDTSDGDGEGVVSNTSGHGDKIASRLSAAGAKTGDIQISISWDNTNDIDLWVEYKNHNLYEKIGWISPRGKSGGWLDIDMNAHPQFLTNAAVENIFWPFGGGQKGTYTIHLNFFHQWNISNVTPVDVRIIIGKKIIKKQIILRRPGEFVKIHTFRL